MTKRPLFAPNALLGLDLDLVLEEFEFPSDQKGFTLRGPARPVAERVTREGLHRHRLNRRDR